MKHAPQAQLDNMAQVEMRVMAHTTEQRKNWTETDWNWHMRHALQYQGFRTFHIREASENGVADLIVYSKVEVHVPFGMALPKPEGRAIITKSCDIQVVDAWLELKKDADLSLIRPGQKEFMRDHWRMGRNAMFVMYDSAMDMLSVRQGDLKGRVKMYAANPYEVKWKEVFAHFKARRVSV